MSGHSVTCLREIYGHQVKLQVSIFSRGLRNTVELLCHSCNVGDKLRGDNKTIKEKTVQYNEKYNNLKECNKGQENAI